LTCKPCPKNAECTGQHTMVGKIFIHAHSARQETEKRCLKDKIFCIRLSARISGFKNQKCNLIKLSM
jgi:hypothetical protein